MQEAPRERRPRRGKDAEDEDGGEGDAEEEGFADRGNPQYDYKPGEQEDEEIDEDGAFDSEDERRCVIFLFFVFVFGARWNGSLGGGWEPRWWPCLAGVFMSALPVHSYTTHRYGEVLRQIEENGGRRPANKRKQEKEEESDEDEEEGCVVVE